MSLPPHGLGTSSSHSLATHPVDEEEYTSSDEESQQRGTFTAAAYNAELDDWSEGGEDDLEQDDPALCLFCKDILPTQAELKAHMLAAHAFDFRAVANKLKLDFYQQMKLINFTRARRAAGDDATKLVTLLTAPNASASRELAFLFDGSEEYLKPFMSEDPLLFSLPKHSNGGADDDDEEAPEQPAAAEEAKSDDAQPPAPSVTALLQENQALRNELAAMQEAMLTMQATLKRVAFAEEESGDAPPALSTDSVAAASSSASAAAASAVVAKSARPAKPAGVDSGSFAPEQVDRDYFGGYSVRNIHELMLRDTIRTEAYRDFIYGAAEIFKDKVVLDVGCGTGILSMFAAKMGAKKVIGVDAADIVHKAREIIAANGLSHIITVLHGKMEEVDVGEKVDIIISEWMGYFLLFESMLPSVLYARDKYLRATPSADQTPAQATGVYPDRAIMYIAGIETHKAHAQRVGWWSNVYGFDMSCLVEEREKYQSSTVEIIRPEQVITSVELLKDINVNTCKDAELDFTQEFVLKVQSGAHPFTAFMVYFDTLFALHCKNVINLSTAPMKDHAPEPELTTHWQQACFYLAKPLVVAAGDVIQGKLKAKRMEDNPRAYDVYIDYALVHDGQTGTLHQQHYKVQ